MLTSTDNEILSEPESTFEADSQQVKTMAKEFANEGTPESHDDLVQLAMDHGLPATPEMDDEQILEKINTEI